MPTAQLCVANWKAFKTRNEVWQWYAVFRKRLLARSETLPRQVVIAPPYLYVPLLADWLVEDGLNNQVAVASQDISLHEFGAKTGEITAEMVASCGTQYAIIGHSERRQFANETSQVVADKATRAVQIGLTPIICVDDPYLEAQASLISNEVKLRSIVAYEALGAIGTGNATDVGKVQEVTEKIHSLFGSVTVLYGGSVKPDNAHTYYEICDGVLVGSASLDAEQFLQIIVADK